MTGPVFRTLLMILVMAGQARAADPPPPNAIARFNLSTGGAGLYRAGKWGVIKVGLRNPQDHDVELLVSTYFVGDPTLQYGRRLWMPAKSRGVDWHPLLMPPVKEARQDFFDLRSMVLNSSSGAETMAMNEVGSMQFDQSFRVASDEPVTAMIVDQSGFDVFDQEWASPQDFVMTARFDRGLRHNFTVLSDPLVPAGEELLDSVDQLVIASDRIRTDAAGIAAIRRWVSSGGRLWIMADRISPALLAALLGDDDNFVEVDRVDLTSVDFETGPWTTGGLTFQRELERPARFVRMIVEHLEPDFLVNGWPAAFQKPYGDGRILVTTLASDGWLRPRTDADPPPPSGKSLQTPFVPGTPLAHMAVDFFVPRSPPRIPHALAEEQVRQLIGYAIPSRSIVLGTLATFTTLMLILAVWAGRRGRLELMGVIAPGLAVASAGVLLGAGWNSRSTIPAATAMIQTVHAVPGTDTVRTSGLAGVFAKESTPRELSGTQGGWMSPEMEGLEGTTRRLVWSDLDQWSWENLAVRPGLRMVPFQTGGRVEQPVDAVAEFDDEGITGRLVLPAGLDPGDAVIVTQQGRVGVNLQPDGTFRSTGVLGADQYLAAHVLTDEQQRRSQVMSQLLEPTAGGLHSDVSKLLVWTRPWEVGTSLVDRANTVGSALVTIPLRWQRPQSGSRLTIPSPFLPFREVMGPDGMRPSGMFDARSRKWLERTGPGSGWLAFSLPADLLPLEVTSATITFKVLGPLERLELSTVDGQRRQSVKVWETPVGTLSHEIKDLPALKLDSRGRLLLRIDVGKRTDKVADDDATEITSGKGNPANYWQFEEVTLQLSAEIPPAATPN